MPSLVLDNGAYTIKAGFAGQSPVSVVNAITRSRDRRVYVGNEVAQCRDFTGLKFRRPIERGHLYSWEAERVIWDSFLDTDAILGSKVDPRETTLILTESPNSLGNLSVNTDQIVFEEYGFAKYRRTNPQSLVAWTDLEKLYNCSNSSRITPADCCLIIDCGYSATNIVPVVRGSTEASGVVRMDVGGKVLTNYLKEAVSLRYYNMMEETYLINAIKEQVCFVSPDYKRDLESWRRNRSEFEIGYVLPDGQSDRLGKPITDIPAARKMQKQGDQQVLILSNERFATPEALFSPQDVDIDQAGLAEAASQSILACPPETRALLWSNVVLVGGSSKFPNIVSRLEPELRALAPQHSTVRLGQPVDPITCAWSGGSLLAQSESVDEWVVSRTLYDEVGESACLRVFGNALR